MTPENQELRAQAAKSCMTLVLLSLLALLLNSFTCGMLILRDNPLAYLFGITSALSLLSVVLTSVYWYFAMKNPAVLNA